MNFQLQFQDCSDVCSCSKAERDHISIRHKADISRFFVTTLFELRLSEHDLPGTNGNLAFLRQPEPTALLLKKNSCSDLLFTRQLID